MKRILPILPLIFLFLLNACGELTAGISPAVGTAVGYTQTASIWTPTITPTPDPDEKKIVDWLNEVLSQTDELERTLDAKYYVLDVYFPTDPYGVNRVFQVYARCECAVNMQCCTPERMFVVIVNAMKIKQKEILWQVPHSLTDLQVICQDHGVQIGIMHAYWSDVKEYFDDKIKGSQFGRRIQRGTLP